DSVHITENCPGYCIAYKWVVPAKVGGIWTMGDGQLELTQEFQMLEGVLRDAGAARPISEARLDGARIRFSVGEDQYVGEVDGAEMRGTINGSRNWRAKRQG